MQSSDVPPSGDAVFFYFPLALLHLGGSVLGFSIADFDKIVNTFLAPPRFPPSE